ncbi:phage scaffold protein [Streptococcus parauberis KCTC 11537]|nr:phage scaffold protein [Streptococcus parauberis KCTC 11537]
MRLFYRSFYYVLSMTLNYLNKIAMHWGLCNGVGQEEKMNENEEILNESGAQEEVKEKTFDELLSDPKNQAEFDKKISKALETARSKWESEKEAEADQAKKLAKMNAEQKAEHEKKQLEARIAELEAEKTRSEMNSIARGMFSEANVVPSEDLINMLVTNSADDTKKAVEGFISLFNDHLDKAVTERLKNPLPKQGGTANTLTKESIMAVKDRTERLRLIEENQALFN